MAATLVALHATVLLLGPGLHATAGWDHGASESLHVDADRARGPVGAGLAKPDDCPVCHLFSQAQLNAEAAWVPTAELVLPVKPDLRPGPAAPEPLRLSSPRAPPLDPSRLA